ncbi:hypothetical protein Tco_1103946 [Tanacetum coccineum]
MLERYNHYITFRADKLPITKISYKINNATKDATMRIERNKQPLSLTFYEKFVLKKLGFSEWIEIHALASKVKSKSNDLLLKKLKAKFEWFKTQAEKLGIPSPSELTAFGLSAAKKKRKRSSEIIQEVFVKDNIVVYGMQRNLIPPPGVEGTRGPVIREPESRSSSTMRGSLEVEEMFAKLELTIEAKNDVIEARKVKTQRYQRLVECKASANSEVLAELKASTSNLRRIQVKYIIKEVEDYLKTYSLGWISAEEQTELKLFFKTELGGKLNNMLWRDKRIFELKPVPSTKLVKVVNSWQNYSLKYGRDVSKNGRALNTSYVLHRILDKLQPPPLSMQPCIGINIECCKE